jgi:carboxypeptidase family protein
MVVGAVVTQLAQPAAQPGTPLVLADRAALDAGELRVGSVVQVGVGANAEFVRLTAVPAAPGSAVPVAPPLARDHAEREPLRLVEDGARVGAVAAAAAPGDVEVSVVGASVTALAPGGIVRLGDGEDASYHQIAAAVEAPGGAVAPVGPAWVGGRVTDESGAAVVAAAITVDELGISAVTDAHGRFVLAPVPAGVYLLRTAATGYAPASKTIEVPAPAPDEYAIQLSPD